MIWLSGQSAEWKESRDTAVSVSEFHKRRTKREEKQTEEKKKKAINILMKKYDNFWKMCTLVP